jgi:hypothetical protein
MLGFDGADCECAAEETVPAWPVLWLCWSIGGSTISQRTYMITLDTQVRCVTVRLYLEIALRERHAVKCGIFRRKGGLEGWMVVGALTSGDMEWPGEKNRRRTGCGAEVGFHAFCFATLCWSCNRCSGGYPSGVESGARYFVFSCARTGLMTRERDLLAAGRL